MKRILITGSRTWTDRAWIEAELDRAAKDLGDTDITLVSGACPRGADRICEQVAQARGWTVERHPADWEAYGRSAGMIRNRDMVRLGADMCIAFVRNSSSGTTNCARAAERAGIRTRWNEAVT